MNQNSQNNRFWQIIIGLFFLMMGLGGIASSGVPALVFLVVGGYLLWQQFGQNGRFPSFNASRWDEDEGYEEIPIEIHQPGTEKVYAHALRAVERAGLDPDSVRVLPVDIGLMAFKDNSDPVVYRSQAIDDDIDYIQPFVQLRLPTKAVGRIKFEIIDGDGQRLFVHEENHQLERGRNLVTPAARLPIHDGHAMQRDWQLRISADGMVLATHTFAWQESDQERIRRHLTEDGEMSNELRAAQAENRLQKMSLDDLLADQETSSPQQRGQRS
jgi:hypothetical protein